METGFGIGSREMIVLLVMLTGVVFVVGVIIFAATRRSSPPMPPAGEALDGLSRTLERMERRLDKIETSVKQEQD